MQTDTPASNLQEKAQAARWLSQSTVTLHTKTAIRLLDGKWRFGYLGLKQFNIATGQLLKAANNGGAHAAQVLQNIKTATFENMTVFKKLESELSEKLNSLRGYSLDIVQSSSPHLVSLITLNPMSIMLIGLIEQIDYLLRQVYSLRRFAGYETKEITEAKVLGEAQRVYALAFTN